MSNGPFLFGFSLVGADCSFSFPFLALADTVLSTSCAGGFLAISLITGPV
jgi:hypothetical protein